MPPVSAAAYAYAVHLGLALRLAILSADQAGIREYSEKLLRLATPSTPTAAGVTGK